MISVFSLALLAGVLYCPMFFCAPAGDNTGNHYNHYGNHYYNYHDYDHHEANKHKGHHEYDGGDDLFGHVKTNLSDHPDQHVYHDLYHYGMSHHEHADNNTEGGGNGLINNIKKFLRNDAVPLSSTIAPLVSVAVAVTFVHKP